ncbi:hypothetical protein NE237_031082 [Protea cynaroides]|uniref:TAFII28-like protein domain-containing protein n=1 Tax=Protea cynaroides TaxID=273540 RepID=A0A9Q0R1S7_9MAGN|nr:hypothetical protein NE237_031082 [Protea cynaroides]
MSMGVWDRLDIHDDGTMVRVPIWERILTPFQVLPELQPYRLKGSLNSGNWFKLRVLPITILRIVQQSRRQMKQSKDPFEVAFEEQQESPPESSVAADETETQTPAATSTIPMDVQEDDPNVNIQPTHPSTSVVAPSAAATAGKMKEEEEEEEENMDVELGKFSSTGDPDKMAKMQAILSQFSEEQMSRYESFRRSGFQKANMKKLLASITGSQKISLPMTIVASGIAKMFVGELVETGIIIMAERKESGPIRPCHIREAYRRLKLEGKKGCHDGIVKARFYQPKMANGCSRCSAEQEEHWAAAVRPSVAGSSSAICCRIIITQEGTKLLDSRVIDGFHVQEPNLPNGPMSIDIRGQRDE